MRKLYYACTPDRFFFAVCPASGGAPIDVGSGNPVAEEHLAAELDALKAVHGISETPIRKDDLDALRSVWAE